MYLSSSSAAGIWFLASVKNGHGLKPSARHAGIDKEVGYRWLREEYLRLRRDGKTPSETTAELGFTTPRQHDSKPGAPRRPPLCHSLKAPGKRSEKHASVASTARNRRTFTGHLIGRRIRACQLQHPHRQYLGCWAPDDRPAYGTLRDRLTRYQDAVNRRLPGLGRAGVAVFVPQMARIPRARKALPRLQTLYDRPVGQPIVDLLLFGPANNGKSRVVEKSRRLLLLPSPWARLADWLRAVKCVSR